MKYSQPTENQYILISRLTGIVNTELMKVISENNTENKETNDTFLFTTCNVISSKLIAMILINIQKEYWDEICQRIMEQAKAMTLQCIEKLEEAKKQIN